MMSAFRINPTKPLRSIPLPLAWFAYQAFNGRVIYYNAATKKSQWTPPIGAGYRVKKRGVTIDDAKRWVALHAWKNKMVDVNKEIKNGSKDLGD
tara:strand:- start:20751 stop:21032 length:282 start_codon:yes stop_codon:yes gene_type:complete